MLHLYMIAVTILLFGKAFHAWLTSIALSLQGVTTLATVAHALKPTLMNMD